MIVLALLLQAAAPADAAPVEGEEVVVTARRGRCELSVADRIISDREFRARAKDWAGGTPVKIAVADRKDYRCMAKILFKLRGYGVTRAEFVAPSAAKP